jgi:polysaccharide biosynthesis protein PslH
MEAKVDKVLFISPTPTHPANAGNRTNILSLAVFLQSQGYELHYLYIAYENFDEQAMRFFFRDRLYIFPREKIVAKQTSPGYYAGRLYFKALRFIRWLQRKSGVITDNQYRYNSETDSHFPFALGPFIKQLQQSHRFRIVICEYAFISKALTFFDNNVFKVLDTHDRFTDRFAIYLQHKLSPAWISLYRDQEKKALRRANLVIAIQENEKDYFESLGKSSVVCFGYIPATEVLPERVFEKKLLYFASGNDLNQFTLTHFIETILPLVVQKHPDVKVLVGGSICRNFTGSHPNVTLLGEFEKLSSFYTSGDIAINPEMTGTGLKIKTLEALAFGMPVISTRAGASGALEPFMDHLLVADEPADFAACIDRLFTNAVLRKTTGSNGKKWIEAYTDLRTRGLLEKLPTLND